MMDIETEIGNPTLQNTDFHTHQNAEGALIHAHLIGEVFTTTFRNLGTKTGMTDFLHEEGPEMHYTATVALTPSGENKPSFTEMMIKIVVLCNSCTKIIFVLANVTKELCNLLG